jgi:hypothetical protein
MRIPFNQPRDSITGVSNDEVSNATECLNVGRNLECVTETHIANFKLELNWQFHFSTTQS